MFEAGADACDYFESGYIRYASGCHPIQSEGCRTLHRNGAEVDDRDDSDLYHGATALHYAVVYNNIEVILH